jgi:hypothetical protein
VDSGDGTSVRIDGGAAMPSPARKRVPVGRHKVEVLSSGGAVVNTRDVIVRPRGNSDLLLLAPSGPLAGLFTRVKPLGEVRALVIPETISEGVAIEVGAGVEVTSRLRGSARARVFPHFGLTPELTLRVPVVDPFALTINVELPLLFPGQFVPGLGATVGGEYFFNPWLGAFAGFGARYFFADPTPNTSGDGPSQLTLQAGVRARLP